MRRLGLLASLALVAAATAACGSSAQDDDMGGAESAVEATSTGSGDALLLHAPADLGSERCRAPSAEVLEGADVAFDGTVREIEHGLVDLEVTRWYRGDAGSDLARVRAQPGALQALVGAVAFEEGGRFLVAGIGSDLLVCGLSGAYDDQLAGLYDEAFGG